VTAARAADPIKIGFSMALTGPLAANGKQALLGAKIWQEEVNAKGGLLGRQVQLINYDDQSNPATVPGIYTKLLDVDKCDLVVGPYATNMVAPAIPVVMQKNKTFIGLFALIFWDASHRNFSRRWLLHVMLWSLPLPWIAAELGWIVAEYGRQPWAIDGVLPTFLAVSSVSG